MADIYAGDELRVSIAFTDASGTPTDPTDATLTWRDAAGTATAASAALAELAKDSAGNYHHDLDTTDFTHGRWVAQVVATGAVAAVDVETFVIRARPL